MIVSVTNLLPHSIFSITEMLLYGTHISPSPFTTVGCLAVSHPLLGWNLTLCCSGTPNLGLPSSPILPSCLVLFAFFFFFFLKRPPTNHQYNPMGRVARGGGGEGESDPNESKRPNHTTATAQPPNAETKRASERERERDSQQTSSFLLPPTPLSEDLASPMW